MFKLNFKENLKNIITKQVSDVVDEAWSPKQDVVESDEVTTSTSTSTSGPLYTDKYIELIRLINSKSYENLNTQKADNLFSTKSAITVLAFLLSSIVVQLDNALLDNSISLQEGMGIAISLIGSISTIAARGSEGSTGVYTPKNMPGLNKEDFEPKKIIKEDEAPFI